MKGDRGGEPEARYFEKSGGAWDFYWAGYEPVEGHCSAALPAMTCTAALDYLGP